jgi:hypothetical protein
MAEFLKDSKLISAIEELIDNADNFLLLVSPYIQLHQKIKDRLKLKKQNPNLQITIVFGKNEEDANKSLSKEDFDFLKEFPNIFIGYEKRLHAKFYASEDFSIITSMNLHQFSQNNNIEVGIKLKSKKWLPTLSGDAADAAAMKYFEDILENCAIIYQKEPVGKGGFFGIGESYSHSEIVTDYSENFFRKKENFSGKKYSQRPIGQGLNKQQGFCIRTGKPIPFNPERPMCFEAFQSWSQYKNKDFAEKFCHKTGKPSHGKTSMRNPILEQ